MSVPTAARVGDRATLGSNRWVVRKPTLRLGPTTTGSGVAGVAVFFGVMVGPFIQFVANPPLDAPRPLLALLFIGFVAVVSVWGLRHPVHWMFAWVGVLTWQNAVLGWSARLVGESPPVWASEMKTAMAYGFAGLLLVNGRSRAAPVWSRWTVALLGATMALGLAISPSSSAIGYLRNFTMYLALIPIGSAVARAVGWPMMRRVLSAACALTLVVIAAGGLIEEIVSTTTWREFLGLQYLEHLRQVSRGTTIFGLPFKRIGSWNIEPVSTAFQAGTAGAVLVVLGWRRHLPLIALSVVLVVTAASKGALLLFVLVVAFRFLGAPYRLMARRPVLALASLWAGIVALGLVYLVASRGAGYVLDLIQHPIGFQHRGESAAAHVSGLVGAAIGMLQRPFGTGLGSGGNFAVAFGGSQGAGDESALGALFVQLGFLGAAGLLLAGRDLARRARRSPGALKIAMPLFAAWICGWVYQEEISGPLSSGLLLLAVGASLWNPETRNGGEDRPGPRALRVRPGAPNPGMREDLRERA